LHLEEKNEENGEYLEAWFKAESRSCKLYGSCYLALKHTVYYFGKFPLKVE